MRLIIAIFLVCLVLIAQPFASSCSSNIPSVSATPTIATTAQIMIDKIMSAMNQIGSYELDSDVLNNYKLVIAPNYVTTITEWKGTKTINIHAQEMSMNMTTISGDISTSFEMYVKDGYYYLENVYAGNVPPWVKSKLNTVIWERETQISNLLEIINTATGLSQSPDENVNGTECYVLNIIPTTQAIIDWVVSQEQPFGTQIDVMFGGGVPVVRPDAYQSGYIKLWVDQDSYLPLKVEMNADFQGYVGGGAHTVDPYTPTTNPIDSSFQGQLNFSNYDQPVTIELPQEALGAK